MRCDQIEVYNSATAKTYFFPCNQWLKKEGNDLSGCRKELLAGSPDMAGQMGGMEPHRVASASSGYLPLLLCTTGPTNYRVEVVTSDIRGAGVRGSLQKHL